MENCNFNSLFNCHEENKLSAHQLGFCYNGSALSQLVAIVYEMYTAFDANPTLETRGVFLNMSRVFDKVWHIRLIYKLESVRVSGDLLNNSFQQVLLGI